jgi:uncharacterized membrane protein YraQ (UPF0718 family)
VSVGLVSLWGVLAVLLVIAVRRGDGSLVAGAERAVEQFAKLVPRMVCALAASGFIAKLIPAEIISRFLGEDAGALAVVIGALAGLIVPSGPVIAFSVAAVFAQADASLGALIAFVTSWSLFAAHRILIYELPMLGPSFLRLRLVSVAALPFMAGGMGMLVGLFATIATRAQP